MTTPVEVTVIETTTRAKAFIALSALLISLGIIYSYSMTIAGIVILIFLACVRGYMLITIVSLNKCKVFISSATTVEGSKIPIEVVFENPTYIPIIFAEIAINYSPHLKLIEGVKGALIIIPPRNIVKLKLLFLARIGTHRIGPINIIIRDLFAFYRYKTNYNVISFIKTRPRISEATVRRLLVFARTTGLTRSRRAGHGSEFYSIREYREGDDVRKIVWKYFLSKQRLVVKEMELETMNRVLFVVDGTSQMLIGPYGYTPFEHCVRAVASIARYLSYRGDLMGIIIAGDREIYASHKLEKKKKGYLDVINIISSYVFDYISTDSIGNKNLDYLTNRGIMMNTAFIKALNLLPREKSVIFIFTSYGDPNFRDALVNLVNRFKSMNNDVYVVIPITTSFEIKGLPEWSYSIYRLKVFERTQKELEFVKQLRKMGVKVIATGAQYTPQTIISIIESLSPA